jgi:hypothetical protein
VLPRPRRRLTRPPRPRSGCGDLGQTRVHEELEREVAAFVGKPAAIVFGMGFATNSLTLPVLMRGKGSLIVSDALNHASIVAGVRASGARVKVFRHNEPEHLERVLRAAIAEGCAHSTHALARTAPSRDSCAHARCALVCVRAQAAAHAPAMVQDPSHCGGHLLDGG